VPGDPDGGPSQPSFHPSAGGGVAQSHQKKVIRAHLSSSGRNQEKLQQNKSE